MKFRKILTTGCLVALLAGCANNSDGGSGKSTQQQLDQVRALAPVEGSDTNTSFPYEQLRAKVARACVREQGHSANDITLAVDVDAADQEIPWNRLAQWVDQHQSTLGTLADDPSVLLAAVEADQGATQGGSGMTEDGGKAFWGFPEETVDLSDTTSAVVSGCWGEAAKTVYGVDARVYEKTSYTAGNIARAVGDAEADPDVQKASKKYSKCMRGEGFKTETPGDFPKEFATLFRAVQTGKSQPEQIRGMDRIFNSADAKCKDSSHVSYYFAAAYLKRREAVAEDTESAQAALAEMRSHARDFAKEGAAS